MQLSNYCWWKCSNRVCCDHSAFQLVPVCRSSDKDRALVPLTLCFLGRSRRPSSTRASGSLCQIHHTEVALPVSASKGKLVRACHLAPCAKFNVERSLCRTPSVASHRKGSKERCLLGQNTISPLSSYKTTLKLTWNGKKWDLELRHFSARASKGTSVCALDLSYLQVS